MTDDQSKRAPYPGLRAFRREETDLFFGREDTINAMVDRLAATRFLAVLGSSGTGKSSLVRTGLLDALELGLMAKAGSRWKIVEFRPGGAPLKNLARRLLETESSDGNESIAQQDVDLLRAFIARGPRAIIEWCRAGHLPQGANLLLLVDQFEELFRYQDYAGREEAEAFVALLLESAREADVAIYVTITMRSEYLGACALIEGLADAINAGMFLTPRMTREHCHEAIVGPAAVCDIAIEPALVNRLLNDLVNFAPWDDHDGNDQLDRLTRRADQLPLLQYTLNRMWQRARERSGDKRNELTVDDYVAIEGLSGALNAHANHIFEDLGKARAQVAEWTFRALTAGSTIADAVRRPTRMDELIAACGGDEAGVRAVVDAFRAPGVNFLAPEFDPNNPRLAFDTYIDISHESLIRQWKKLSEWVAAEGRASQQWRRLVDRFGSGEMMRGRELANLVAWRTETKPNAAWAKRYGGDYPTVIAYLDKSQRAQDTKRVSMIASVVGAFALITGIAVYAILQRNDAQEQSQQNAQRVTEIEALGVQMQANQDFVTATFEKVLFSLEAPLTSGGGTSPTSTTRRAQSRAPDPSGDPSSTDVRTDEQSAGQPETTVDATPQVSVDRMTTETVTRQGLALTTVITLEQAARELHNKNSDDTGFRRLFVVALNQLGDVWLQSNDPKWSERSESAYNEALERGHTLLLVNPNDDAWRADRALSLAGIARIRVRNKSAEARKYFEDAIEIERQLIRESPDEDGFLKNLQAHLGQLGDFHISRSERGEALTVFKERLDVREKRLEAHKKKQARAPRNVQMRDDLYQLQSDVSVALDRVGQLVRDNGDLNGSRKYFVDAIAIDRELFRINSTRRPWQENLVFSLTRIGDLEFRLSRYRQALPPYEEARDLQRKLATDSNQAGPLQTMASILGRVGDIKRRLRDFPAAISAHREELDLRRKILALDRSNLADARRSVSSALDYLGNALRESKDVAGARNAFNEQLKIDRSVLADFPSQPRSREDVAWSLTRLGDLDRDAGTNNEAGRHYQEALGFRRELSALEPESPARMRALALILSKLGQIRSRLNDHTTALTLHHEELELRRKLYKPASEDTDALRDLSLANDRVGNVLRDMDDFKGAFKFYVEELGLDRSFVARWPNNLTALNDLQWTLNKVFDFARQRLGDRQSARKYLEEMIGIDRQLIERQPNNKDRHKRLKDDLVKLANLLLDMSDPAAARQSYDEVFVAYQRWIGIADEAFKKASTDANRNDLVQAYGDAGWHGILAARAKDALPLIETALKLNPNTPWNTVNLGHAYLFLGRYAEALELFKSVKDRNRTEDGKRKYADEIKDDFAIFRRLGLTLPDSNRVERELNL